MEIFKHTEKILFFFLSSIPNCFLCISLKYENVLLMECVCVCAHDGVTKHYVNGIKVEFKL